MSFGDEEPALAASRLEELFVTTDLCENQFIMHTEWKEKEVVDGGGGGGKEGARLVGELTL